MATDLEKTIDEIQSKLDIAEVIGEYIPLKRAGRNFKGLCPFHHEKTPSFMVSSTKQIYHCFGCGAGGDMINFVMKHEGLEFMEALRILADKASVTLPQFNRSGKPQQRSFASFLYKINELAANYYNALLIGSGKAAQARRYLAERYLNAKTVSDFKIGYAAEGWDNFLKFAREKGFSVNTLEKAGLIIPGRESSHYDRFRNRVIFPIFDIRSKVIAFGARVLDDSQPKYMNSPETDLYIKGRHLYGLNFAVEQIKQKDYVIIVEGYIDLLILYQSGIKNAVATLGTALTVEQIRLIRRFTNNVVIIFDADEAGEAASLRGLDLLLSEGLYVKISRLPEGFDPDTYVRKYSADSFIKLVESADNLFDYKLKLLLKRLNPAEPEEKTKITTEMLPTIKRIENAVLRSDYMKKLSEVLFVKEEVLLEELGKVKLDYSYLGENRIFKERVKIRPADKIITGLMVEDPEIAQQVRQELRPEDFQSEDIRSIVTTVFEMIAAGRNPTPAKVIQKLNDDTLSHVICECLTETENLVDREKSLLDCIQWVKLDNIKMERTRLTGLLKEAETKGDEARMMELVKKLDTLRSVKF